MILFDFGFFVILTIAVMLPVGIALRIGYYLGKKDTIKYLQNMTEENETKSN